jgi:hypothetical protein
MIRIVTHDVVAILLFVLWKVDTSWSARLSRGVLAIFIFVMICLS